MKVTRSCFSLLKPGKPPYRILFFGTDFFAIPPLKMLLQNAGSTNNRLIEHVEVVCPPERRRVINKKLLKGTNHMTVREFAQEQDLLIHYWQGKDGWPNNYCLNGPYDIGVVASFGYLIPNRVLDVCLRGSLNIHPSLLPQWRGAAPMTYAILEGAKQTGVSIVEVSRNRFDRGKIFLQEKFQIPDNVMFDELSTSLSIQGTKMLFRALSNFDEMSNNAKLQSNVGISHAPKATKEIGFINWNEHTWLHVWRTWRALSTRVGVHTSWKGKKVRLVTMTSDTFEDNLDELEDALPGQPRFDKEKNILFIKCKDGWAGFTSLQVECKSVISAKDFSNSYLQTSRHSKNHIFEILDSYISESPLKEDKIQT
ncbi:methionyl-tRNA formyltransferase, mitochondrial-like [Actinia tenebrosa]|uniref:Methionyl-tRNA formyltransferase, mitochondrial n=1 Tax=Actinia tenebrosa TaxID=6105 RepID=A0A6P8IQQ0_ACTTE|nr:methionyl-tRNA formyltransferase, mitochondrial-like [Actinia tenebrosa]